MVITVADEGNKRKGEMSKEEQAQCVSDILFWFRRNKTPVQDSSTSEDLQPLAKALGGKLASLLEILLMESKNIVFYEDKRGMNAEEIIDAYQTINIEGVVPFAVDLDGNDYLVIGVDGEVKEWNEDDGLEEDEVHASFEGYVEEYRNNLLASKFEYVEDCGCMAKASKARK